MTNKKNSQHGRKQNQKLKPYLVMQYLLQESDEQNAVPASAIIEHLNDLGISAEKKSIYRDIQAINKAMLIAENSRDGEIYTIKQAEAELKAKGDFAKYIIYNPSKKGFYVNERRYSVDEIRLAAECIYAAKFLTEDETETFVDMICGFVSNYQADDIKHDVFLTDRIKTNNKNTYQYVTDINFAMEKEYDENDKLIHSPEKISFKYLKHSINDLKQKVERRRGERYYVSPYKLLINDGNYYMLGYDDKYQSIRTFRVDRMQDLKLTGQPREGADAFRKIDMKTYTQRVFSMFPGDSEHIAIQFANKLLDTVVERFGTKGVQYTKADDAHFTVSVQVDVSDQFFGWICGFGDQAKIIFPQKVKDRFIEYINTIKNQY